MRIESNDCLRVRRPPISGSFKWRAVSAALIVLSICVTQAVAAEFKFRPLGFIPGGYTASGAFDVSDDGSVVVGDSLKSGAFQAFRWTESTGMVGLGNLGGTPKASFVGAISGDGSVIVGRSFSSSRGEGFRWTAAEGMQSIGVLPGSEGFQFASAANDVTADGTTAVGSGVGVATRYTQATGLEALPNHGPMYTAVAVSADGSVILGQQANVAYLWTEATGAFELGDLPGGNFRSTARGISADGKVVVGHGTTDKGDRAFKWTAADGMVPLANVAGDNIATGAFCASGDGSIIAGEASFGVGMDSAALWIDNNGPISLQQLLLSNGVSGLEGWRLRTIYSITPDGKTVVGSAYNPQGVSEAFLATIPEPPSVVLAAFALTAAVAKSNLLKRRNGRRRSHA